MKPSSMLDRSPSQSELYPLPDEPASPCNLVCKVDSVSGFCIGCYRSMDEICAWPTYSAAQKRVVLAALPARHPGSAQTPKLLVAGG